MKKILCLLTIGFIGAFQANAQRIQVGPEIGVNFSNFRSEFNGIDGDNDVRAGLKIGGVVDIGFTRMISFQPGLYFSQKGAQESYSSSFVDGGILYYEDEELKTRVNYLEMPLNLQFKFGRSGFGSFFVGGGPYVAFAMGGKVDYEYSLVRQNGVVVDRVDDDYDLEVGNDKADDDVKGTDAGINLNAGFMSRRGFFARGNFGLGLANIVPGGDDDFYAKNTTFSLTVGFLFGR